MSIQHLQLKCSVCAGALSECTRVLYIVNVTWRLSASRPMSLPPWALTRDMTPPTEVATSALSRNSPGSPSIGYRKSPSDGNITLHGMPQGILYHHTKEVTPCTVGGGRGEAEGGGVGERGEGMRKRREREAKYFILKITMTSEWWKIHTDVPSTYIVCQDRCWWSAH